MIDLGLARVSALLRHTPQSWKAIHVAGTNGKGSICAYLTAMLRANRLTCGRFTSPHLVDRWDCITINDAAVDQALFRHFEDLVKRRDLSHNLGATEFELLTATALEIFEAQNVDFGVVEVGLGGKLDATNTLSRKAATVVSKIGLDHQSFLGDTLAEIALHKAGIMRPGVPCVLDASNASPVLDAVKAHAQEIGAPLHFADPDADELVRALDPGLEPHQRQNLACAHQAFQAALPGNSVSVPELARAVNDIVWPGRLQSLSLARLTGREQPVLMDGAHNPQAAAVLASYVDKHLRHEGKPVTWILAASDGKDMTEILKLILRGGDSVIGVEFGPVDGMPWVKAMRAENILHLAGQRGIPAPCRHVVHGGLQPALQLATEAAKEGPLAIAGSLYLVSDVLRLLRTHRQDGSA